MFHIVVDVTKENCLFFIYFLFKPNYFGGRGRIIQCCLPNQLSLLFHTNFCLHSGLVFAAQGSNPRLKNYLECQLSALITKLG